MQGVFFLHCSQGRSLTHILGILLHNGRSSQPGKLDLLKQPQSLGLEKESLWIHHQQLPETLLGSGLRPFCHPPGHLHLLLATATWIHTGTSAKWILSNKIDSGCVYPSFPLFSLSSSHRGLFAAVLSLFSWATRSCLWVAVTLSLLVWHLTFVGQTNPPFFLLLFFFFNFALVKLYF